jgi:hypothetical protein
MSFVKKSRQIVRGREKLQLKKSENENLMLLSVKNNNGKKAEEEKKCK